MDTATALEKCQEMNAHGQSTGQLIEFLQRSGITITESIKIVKQTLGLSLGNAKKIVSSHPAWRGIAQAAEPLHQELAREFSSPKQRGGAKTKSQAR